MACQAVLPQALIGRRMTEGSSSPPQWPSASKIRGLNFSAVVASMSLLVEAVFRVTLDSLDLDAVVSEARVWILATSDRRLFDL
jgi:hypothetical protein